MRVFDTRGSNEPVPLTWPRRFIDPLRMEAYVKIMIP